MIRYAWQRSMLWLVVLVICGLSCQAGRRDYQPSEVVGDKNPYILLILSNPSLSDIEISIPPFDDCQALWMAYNDAQGQLVHNNLCAPQSINMHPHDKVKLTFYLSGRNQEEALQSLKKQVNGLSLDRYIQCEKTKKRFSLTNKLKKWHQHDLYKPYAMAERCDYGIYVRPLTYMAAGAVFTLGTMYALGYLGSSKRGGANQPPTITHHTTNITNQTYGLFNIGGAHNRTNS